MTIDMGTIDARRAEISDRLALLRRQRGAALLDGASFDQDEIDALADELEALSEAEAESVRRDRSAHAEDIEQQRRAVASQLAADNTRREAAIVRAQAAANELGAALGEIMSAGHACVVAMRALGVHPNVGTGPEDTAIRYSIRLAGALRPATGIQRRFGLLHLPEPRLAADWLEDERGTWATAFAAIEEMEI